MKHYRELIKESNRRNGRNVVRIHPAESEEHFIEKARIAFRLVREGHEVYTEAHFETGGGADVFDATTGEIIEICCSEADKQLSIKVQKYPTSAIETVRVEHRPGKHARQKEAKYKRTHAGRFKEKYGRM